MKAWLLLCVFGLVCLAQPGGNCTLRDCAGGVKYGRLVVAYRADTVDAKTAAGELAKANADADADDPFIQGLPGQAYEKPGAGDKATELYNKAAGMQSHNPPAAYAKWFTKAKL